MSARLAAGLLRVKAYLKDKVDGKQTNFEQNFSVSELQGAETALIKYLQSKYLRDFFSAHTDKERLESLPTSLQKLQPFVHNGVVRVGGRLSQADVAFDLKHPIILPPDSHFTEMIIR